MSRDNACTVCPYVQKIHFSLCQQTPFSFPFSLFAFTLSPLVHTFLSVLSSWRTRLFCWFSEKQFGPSKGQRQVKFCFDDSKWSDYPNERQLSKPHPSLSAFQYLRVFFYSAQCSHSTISGYSSYSLLDSTRTPIFPSLSFLIMFFCIHHLNLWFVCL